MTITQQVAEKRTSGFGVAVGSASTGLLLALRALGVKDGAYVLAPGLSCLATAEIIRLAGGRVIFVDVNPNTYCIDPHYLEYAIQRTIRLGLPMPIALVADDLFGLPADYERLRAVAERYSLALIENMGEGFGASLGGRRAGSFGDMAVGSLFPEEAERGEGGVVFCSSEEEAERLFSLRRALDPKESALSALGDSIGAERFLAFPEELGRRRAIAAQYRERLGGCVKLQQIPDGFVSAYTRFAISPPKGEREGMLRRLQQKGIPVTVFEPSPALRRGGTLDRVALVNARAVAEGLLLIPMHPYLSRRVVDFVCDAVKGN